MWPFKKKEKHILKTVYKVSYVLSASIDKNKVTFDLDCMDAVFIEAEDSIDAQMQFAKKMVIHPHVYIHSIEKVIDIRT